MMGRPSDQPAWLNRWCSVRLPCHIIQAWLGSLGVLPGLLLKDFSVGLSRQSQPVPGQISKLEQHADSRVSQALHFLVCLHLAPALCND